MQRKIVTYSNLQIQRNLDASMDMNLALHGHELGRTKLKLCLNFSPGRPFSEKVSRECTGIELEFLS